MIQNVYTILLTNPGTRLFLPNYGVGLSNRVFSVIDDSFKSAIISDSVDAINEYEPRVVVDELNTFVKVDSDTNNVLLVLAIQVPTGSVRYISLTLGQVDDPGVMVGDY